MGMMLPTQVRVDVRVSKSVGFEESLWDGGGDGDMVRDSPHVCRPSVLGGLNTTWQLITAWSSSVETVHPHTDQPST